MSFTTATTSATIIGASSFTLPTSANNSFRGIIPSGHWKTHRHNYLSAPADEHIHALHDEILFRIVRMLLAWDFQNGRDRLVVLLQEVMHAVRDVLIDKDDPNVIPLGK